jgi:glycosyltransferase involved in cell wall biosynthesis
MKKTILHIIYNLGRGGAETMLVAAIKELKDYDNIVVTLDAENEFGDELKADKLICLNTRSSFMVPIAVIRLKKIIREYKPDIVHSHLFWPTVIARLATPKNIPLITTIHSFIATSMEYKAVYIRWIDKLTYQVRKSIIVAVAKGALSEYFSFLKLKPYKAYCLHTFVDMRIFKGQKIFTENEDATFKLISAGALRIQKNQKYYIEAFKQLKNDTIELHIYGAGPLKEELERSLLQNDIKNIKLMGAVNNLNELIPAYDLFTMCSTFEGFSLAVLEAMALQMPLLLSDIASFREQCEDIAEYFDLENTTDFVNKLRALKADKNKLKEMGNAAKARVIANFTQDRYMAGLRKIYNESLQN